MRLAKPDELAILDQARKVLAQRGVESGSVIDFDDGILTITEFPISRGGRGVNINHRGSVAAKAINVFLAYQRPKEETLILVHQPRLMWRSALRQLASEPARKVEAA